MRNWKAMVVLATIGVFGANISAIAADVVYTYDAPPGGTAPR